MNQILYSKNFSDSSYSHYDHHLFHKKKRKLWIVFLFSFIIFSLLFIYFCIYLYHLYQKEKNAQQLAQSFSVESLYLNHSDYNTSPSLYYAEKSYESPFVIGIIEIDKIHLHYPILADATEDFLKISPCRFAGPMPNHVGNLCIAGHNYLDNSFFGKLRQLEIDDKVKIYDLSGNVVSYQVFYKTEVENNDFRCTSQNTNGQRVITLMTCNSMKDTRFLFIAKEATT